MTREEKCKKAIEKGFKYDAESGIIFNSKNEKVTSKNNHGYNYLVVYCEKEKKSYKLLSHHFAWYITYGEIVNSIDHINMEQTDNRIANLRSVTTLKNQWNQRKRKGYTFFKRDNKWKAQISYKGKQIHIGYFDTEEEAHNAYLNEKQKLHDIIWSE
jgi:hypothetical protein